MYTIIDKITKLFIEFFKLNDLHLTQLRFLNLNIISSCSVNANFYLFITISQVRDDVSACLN